MLEVAGGNRDEVGNTWGGTHPLGLWTPAPEKLRCQATPGEGRIWAVLDPESDSLWTGWKVGLCEKLCAC